MNARPIKSPATYRATLKKIDSLMGAKPGTAAGDSLDALVKLIEAYERTRFPMKRLRPVHPGNILVRDFATPLLLTPRQLADALHVDVRAISGIMRGRQSMTAEMALRLSRYFGTTARLWLDLQNQYDLEVAQRKMGKTIARIIQPLARPDLKNRAA